MEKKTKKGFFSEFKEFIMRGNVIDLAVGVIIGAAFQAIINSMVKDIITPLLGKLFGDIDFSNLFVVLSDIPATADASQLSSLTYVRDTLGLPVFAYGSFITAVIHFLIMAFVIFLMVKGINKLYAIKLPVIGKKNEQKKQTPVEPETKICPYCLEEIPYKAAKCKYCASEQPALTMEGTESEV